MPKVRVMDNNKTIFLFTFYIIFYIFLNNIFHQGLDWFRVITYPIKSTGLVGAGGGGLSPNPSEILTIQEKMQISLSSLCASPVQSMSH